MTLRDDLAALTTGYRTANLDPVTAAAEDDTPTPQPAKPARKIRGTIPRSKEDLSPETKASSPER